MPHEAEVKPYTDVVDGWVTCCPVPGCPMDDERFATRDGAERRRDEHRTETT